MARSDRPASTSQRSLVCALMGKRQVDKSLAADVEAAFASGLTHGDVQWLVPQLQRMPTLPEHLTSWWQPQVDADEAPPAEAAETKGRGCSEPRCVDGEIEVVVVRGEVSYGVTQQYAYVERVTCGQCRGYPVSSRSKTDPWTGAERTS